MIRGKQGVLLLLLFFLFIGMLITSAVFAESIGVSISVDDREARPGEIVSIPINFTSGGRVAGVQFAINYDGELLQYQNTEPGSMVSEFAVAANPAAGTDNQVKLIIISLTGKLIPEGTGVLATVDFKVSDEAVPAQCSSINLTGTVLSDSEGKQITQVDISPGEFKVLKTAGNNNSTGGSSSNEEIETSIIIPNFIFSDIKEDHWAADDIYTLSEKKIVSGDTEGTFRPDSLITRAEFTQIIAGAMGLSLGNSEKPSYQDVAPGAWYFDSVEAATGVGIVTGDGTGNFYPNEKISRQEIAIILVRAMGKEIEALSHSTDITDFSDDLTISSWARGFVVIAVQEGLISGYPHDSTFRPGNDATRAESCVMINRFRNNHFAE